MENFEFTVPTRVIFGKGAEKQAAARVKEYGSRVLLHYGGGHIVRSGLLDQVKKQLEEAGIVYQELGGVKPNPRLSLVKEGIRICREKNLDMILAIGGASVIDSSKAIGIGVPYEGEVWDFYEGKASVTKSLPVGVILTMTGAGSEAAEGSVITKEEGWLKRSVGSYFMRPKFALLNPELTYSLSPYQTACGVSDALSHIMEYYFTGEKQTDVSDGMCEGVMRALIKNGKIAVQEPENYEARAHVMWSATVAQMGFLNCTRVGQWAAHEIEHEISAIYDVPHGAGMAVVFPAWMKYAKEFLPERFRDFAANIWGKETIEEGIAAYEGFLQEIGLPLTMKDLGIQDDRIREMGEKAVKNGPLGSCPKLALEDVLNIYELCK